MEKMLLPLAVKNEDIQQLILLEQPENLTLQMSI